ncbi:notch [Salpingoeca rosetta]|uniref:Notch n=1 Tax=Salpingoeca rosetta (strain ATCC 50818 / BSB-021) TaxID=946362 RepID=F2U8X5_SALR5|nr:notch [Salpingoeca rosetta]EGD73178.1 notch [Salpingoeca rosetta]|eukprot:XP_004994209.1 notch [Salpingoeca rosetta]
MKQRVPAGKCHGCVQQAVTTTTATTTAMPQNHHRARIPHLCLSQHLQHIHSHLVMLLFFLLASCLQAQVLAQSDLCQEAPCGFVNSTCRVEVHESNDTATVYERVCGCEAGYTLVLPPAITTTTTTTSTTQPVNGNTTTTTATTITSITANGNTTAPAMTTAAAFHVLTPSYANATCQDINACAWFPCGDNSICTDLPAPAPNSTLGRTCTCAPGFELAPGQPADGNCVDIDACAANPCHTNANCTDLPAPADGTETGRVCSCLEGYAGDGITNCTNINACSFFPCHPEFGVCTDLPPPAPNSTEGRSCRCDYGYTGNGEDICFDVNACRRNPCDVNAMCTDLPPPALNRPEGRICDCYPGFFGDGDYCIGEPLVQVVAAAENNAVRVGSYVTAFATIPVTASTSNVSVLLRTQHDTPFAKLVFATTPVMAFVVNGTIHQTFNSTDRNVTGAALPSAAVLTWGTNTYNSNSNNYSSIPFAFERVNDTAVLLSFGLLDTTHPASPPAVAVTAQLAVLGDVSAGRQEELSIRATVVHDGLHPVPISATAYASVVHPSVDAVFSPSQVPPFRNALETTTVAIAFTAPSLPLYNATIAVVAGAQGGGADASAQVINATLAFPCLFATQPNTTATTTGPATANSTWCSGTSATLSALNTTAGGVAEFEVELSLTDLARSNATVTLPEIEVSFFAWPITPDTTTTPSTTNTTGSAIAAAPAVNPRYTQRLQLNPRTMRLPTISATTTLSTISCFASATTAPPPSSSSSSSSSPQSDDADADATAVVVSAPGALLYMCTEIAGPYLRFDLGLQYSLQAGLASSVVVSTNAPEDAVGGASGAVQAIVQAVNTTTTNATAAAGDSDTDRVLLSARDLLVNTSTNSLIIQTAIRISSEHTPLLTAGQQLSIDVQAVALPGLASAQAAIMGASHFAVELLEPALELAYVAEDVPHHLDAGDVIAHRIHLAHRPWSSAPAYDLCVTLTASPFLSFISPTDTKLLLPQGLNCTLSNDQSGHMASNWNDDADDGFNTLTFCCAQPLSPTNNSSVSALVLSTVAGNTAPLTPLYFAATATYTSAPPPPSNTSSNSNTTISSSSIASDPNTVALASAVLSANNSSLTDPVRHYVADVERNTTHVLAVPLVHEGSPPSTAAGAVYVNDASVVQEVCVTAPFSPEYQDPLPASIVDGVQVHLLLELESSITSSMTPTNWSIVPRSIQHTAFGFEATLLPAETIVTLNSTFSRVVLRDMHSTASTTHSSTNLTLTGALQQLLSNMTASTVDDATICFDVQRQSETAAGATSLFPVQNAAVVALNETTAASARSLLTVEYRTPSAIQGWPAVELQPSPSPWFEIGTTVAPTSRISLHATDNADTPSNDVSLHEILTFEARVELPFGEYNLTLDFVLDPYTNKNAFVVPDASDFFIASLPACLSNTTAFAVEVPTMATPKQVRVVFGTVQCKQDPSEANTVFPADNTLKVQLQTAVVDEHAADPLLSANRRRHFVDLTAEYTSALGTNTTAVWWADVTVVHPQLRLLTWMDTDARDSEAGDVVTYMFYVTHDVNSTAPAYDLQLLSTPNVHHAIQNDTIKCLEFCDAEEATQVTATDQGGLLFTIPRLPLGKNAYWRWKATVLQTVPAGRRLRSDYDFRFDTHPRNASTATPLDDSAGVPLVGYEDTESTYHTMDIEDANFTGLPVFSSIATTRESPRYDVVPDELFILNYTITLPASTTDTRVTIYMPSAYIALSGTVTGVGGLIRNSSLDAGDMADLLSGGRSVKFDFGRVQRLIAAAASSSSSSSSSQQNGTTTMEAEEQASSLFMSVLCHAEPSFFGSNYALRDTEQLIFARLSFDGSVADVEVNTTAREPRLLLSDPINHRHDAGDVVTFAVVLNHDNRTTSADAYDVFLAYAFSDKVVPDNATAVACLVNTTDPLVASAPACLPLASTIASPSTTAATPANNSSSVNSTGTTTATSTSAMTTTTTTSTSSDGGGDNSLPLTLTAQGFELRLAHLRPFQRVHIVIEGQVVQDVIPQDKLVNSASLRYDTSPDNETAAYPGKEYALDLDVTTVVVSPVARYEVTSLSEAETLDNVLTIGEEATVDVLWNLPEGEMPGAVLAVSVPPHTTFLNATIVRIGRSISGSNVVPYQTYDDNFAVLPSDPTAVLIDLGDLSNTFNNTVNLQDDIHVRVRFFVDNDPANALNTFINVETGLAWLGSARWVDSSYPIKIAEPLVSSSVSTPTARPDAQDLLTYTTIVQHDAASTSPIYRATVVVTTPAEVQLQTGSIDIFSGTVLSSTPTLRVVNASVFEVGFEKMSVLASDGDEKLTITYDVVVVDEIRANEDIIVTTTNSWWSTPTNFTHPGRFRDGFNDTSPYFGETSQHINPAKQNSVTMYLDRSSLEDTIGTQVNVAEELVYRSCITVLEGHTNVSLAIAMHSGLDFLNASLYSVGADIAESLSFVEGDMFNATTDDSTGGPLVLFAFGELVNTATNVEDDGDAICIELAALVANIPENINGIVLPATATLVTDTTQLTSSTETVRVIEPVVTTDPVAITIPGQGAVEVLSIDSEAVDAGDEVSFEITVRHLPSSTSTTFDVFIEAHLPDYTAVVSVQQGTLPTTINTTVPGYVVWHLPKLTLEEESYTTSVTVRVRNDIIPSAADLKCDVTTTAHSSPLADNADAKAFTSVAESAVLLVKGVNDDLELVSTSIAATAGYDVAVHELATFQYTLVLPEGTVPSITLIIDQPSDDSLRLDRVELHFGANVACEGVPVLEDAAGAVDHVLQFDNCVNTYDNEDDDADLMVVTIVTVVQDVVSTLEDRNKAMRFRLQTVHTHGTPGSTRKSSYMETLRLQLPNAAMALDTVVRNHVLPGDTLQFDATVEQDGNFLAPMFNTSLDIAIPSSLIPVLVLVGVNGAPLTDHPFTLRDGTNGTATSVLSIPLATILPDDTAAVRVLTEVGSDVEQGLAIAANATLTFDTSEGSPTYPGRVYAVADDFKTLYVAALVLTQDIVRLNFPGETDVTEVSVYEPLTLRHTVRVRGSYALTTTISLPAGGGAGAGAGGGDEEAMIVDTCTTVSVGDNVLITPGATSPGNVVQPTIVHDANTHTITLAWGDAVNEATSAVYTQDDDIVYECNARVRNLVWIEAGDVFALGGNAEYAVFTSSEEHMLTVSDPELVFASFTPSFGATEQSPVTPVQAQEAVTFDFAVNNSLAASVVAATAFDAQLLLFLPGISNAVVASADPSTQLEYDTDLEAYRLLVDRVGEAEMWTVTLAGTAITQLPVGVPVEHSAQLSWLSTADPTRELARLHTEEPPTSWTMTVRHPQLDLAVYSTRTVGGWRRVAGDAQAGSNSSPAPEVTVGGVIWLTLTVDVYAGLHTDLKAVLDVPEGLVLVDHVVSDGHPNIDLGAGPTVVETGSADGEYEFVFGSPLATAEDTVVLNVYLRVADDKSVNFNGAVKTLRAHLDYTEFTNQDDQQLDVVVVYPLLQLTGDTSVATADAGDTIVLTQLLRHTDQSEAPAYNITVGLMVPGAALLTNVTAVRSMQHTGTNGTVFVEHAFEQYEPTPIIDLGLLNETDAVVVTWTFVVQQRVQPSSTLAFAAAATYKHGSLTTSRQETAVMAPLDVVVPGIHLQAPGEDDEGRARDYGVGDVIHMQVDMDLPEGTLPELVVDLHTTPGTAIVGASLSSLTGHIFASDNEGSVAVMQGGQESALLGADSNRRRRRASGNDDDDDGAMMSSAANATQRLFDVEADANQRVSAVRVRVFNVTNNFNNVEDTRDRLVLNVTVAVLDDEAISRNTTVNVTASVSVPWSAASVAVSPTYNIGEPALNVETFWAFDDSTAVLVFVHTIAHANNSDLNAANLHLTSNVTGTLIVTTSNMTNGTDWDLLVRGESIVAYHVVVVDSASPQGASVCVQPTVEYNNAGSSSPRAYAQTEHRDCFKLPEPARSRWQRSMFVTLLAIACGVLFLVLLFLAVSERRRRRRGGKNVGKLPKPAKVMVRPTSLIRRQGSAAASSPRDALALGNDDEDMDYLVVGDDIDHTYAAPRGPLIALGDGLYAEIDQVLEAHAGDEEGDYYCTINSAFQDVYEDINSFYANARVRLPDGTYAQMNRYFFNDDGKLRRKNRDTNDEHIYEEIPEDDPIYEEIKDVLAGTRPRQPMPVIRTKDNRQLGLRRVFRRNSDGSLVPCFYHDSGLYADAAVVRTENGEYADASDFFKRDGRVFEPLYEEAHILHDTGEYAGAREAMYDVANPSHDEYLDADAIYDIGEAQGDERMYDMGADVQTDDPIYTMGNDNEEGLDAIYDMGQETGTDAQYALGNTDNADADGDATYDVGNADAVYGASADDDDTLEPVYDAGQEGLNSADPLYDVANRPGTAGGGGGGADGGGTRVRKRDSEPTYDTATFRRRASDQPPPLSGQRLGSAADTYDLGDGMALGGGGDGDATYDIGNEEGDALVGGNSHGAGTTTDGDDDAVYTLGDEMDGFIDDHPLSSVVSSGQSSHRHHYGGRSSAGPMIVAPEPSIRNRGDGDDGNLSVAASSDVYSIAKSDASRTGGTMGHQHRHHQHHHRHQFHRHQQQQQQHEATYAPYPLQDGADDIYDVSPLNNAVAPEDVDEEGDYDAQTTRKGSSNMSNAGSDGADDLYAMANKFGYSGGGRDSIDELPLPPPPPLPLPMMGANTAGNSNTRTRPANTSPQQEKRAQQRYKPVYEALNEAEDDESDADDGYQRADSTDEDEDEDSVYGHGRSGSERGDSFDADALETRAGPNNTLVVKRRGTRDVEDIYSVIQKATTPPPPDLPSRSHSCASSVVSIQSLEASPKGQRSVRPPPRLRAPSGQVKQKSTISMEWDPHMQ